jgi:hypothetical protein
MYTAYKNRILTGGAPDLTSVTLKLALVDNTYTPNLATDEFFSAPASLGPAVMDDYTFTTPAVANGALDLEDAEWLALTTPSAIEYLVLYVDGASPGVDDFLVAVFDTTVLPDLLPFGPPTGQDFKVKWNALGVITL